MLKYCYAILLATTAFSCTDHNGTPEENPKRFQSEMSSSATQFYHWKKSLVLDDVTKDALKTMETKRVYVRYFDLEEGGQFSGPQPTYLIDTIDQVLKDYDIVPVIYVKNEALSDVYQIEQTSKKVKSLIDEISMYYFGKTIKTIQVDCDWTKSTAKNYFYFLEWMNYYFDTEVTIRLHQIKYAEETGVPPVGKGTLMCYNVGNLADFDRNSILDAQIVASYINSETSYPIPLDVALPIYDQTVVKNRTSEHVRLINENCLEDLKNHPRHFKEVSDGTYEVIADTIYRTFALSPGMQLQVEESEISAINESLEVIRNSNLVINDYILYHLDSTSITNINLSEINL